MTPAAAFGLRLAASVALLTLVCWRIDFTQLVGAFDTFEGGWAIAALALTVPQVLVSAWRWRLTAHRVGLELPIAHAIREYYLATFLNQVLPGGVLGDANRAWRHGRATRKGAHDTVPAWHAVVIERVSGQLSLGLVALVAVACAPALQVGLLTLGSRVETNGVVAALIGAASLAAAAALLYRQTAGVAAAAWRFAVNTRRALLGAYTGWAQLLSSLLVTASYIGVFVLSSRVIGMDTPLAELWVLVPPVLIAMAIPLSVAGWGLREGAAALIWPLAGLPAYDGVALSLTYGTLVLISSLPGALMLASGHGRSAGDTRQPAP